MHALEDYGLMHVKLYEDIARTATSPNLRLSGQGRWPLRDGSVADAEVRQPQMNGCAALQLFGAGARSAYNALPPYTRVESLDFDDHPFERTSIHGAVRTLRSKDVYLDEVVTDDKGGRMFVCSDTDHCESQRARGGVD